MARAKTPIQKATFHAIDKKLSRKDGPPTLAELAEHFGAPVYDGGKVSGAFRRHVLNTTYTSSYSNLIKDYQ